MDAVDAVLLTVDSEEQRFEVAGHFSRPMPAALRESLQLLCAPGNDDLQRLGEADVAVGKLFAETALELLSRQRLAPAAITAIGSHGQTVRHCPPSTASAMPFTLQIGDPNTIAAKTGITTVADFRRKDMALGGEAAPLAPAFHQAVFRAADRNRAVINLGGIANITWLPAAGSVIGFDTGPANCLMDGWIENQRQLPFDNDGAWARSGKVVEALLAAMLQEPYLALNPPKSTGRELFNQPWLDSHLRALGQKLRPEDIQATLCRYTVLTVAGGLRAVAGDSIVHEIFICGGGASNGHLLSQLEECLAPATVKSTAAAGIHPLQVEGAAFAWLAHRTLMHLPGNIPEVSGARRPAVLGGIYYP